MSSLSIRKLPREIEEALKAEAKKQGKTKSDIVINALGSTFGFGNSAKRRAKLHSFFGKLSKEEYETVTKAISDFSRIDTELWK